MTQAVTPREARRTRKPYPAGHVITDYIGSHLDGTPRPAVHLSELPPGYVIDPHFHGTNQYQLVTEGSGTLGKHTLVPGSLHYTDAYSPYGPIVAGKDGLAYLTLRQTAYVGAHFMPGSRDLMKRRAGRNLMVELKPAAHDPIDRPLRQDADGVAMHRLTAPAGVPLAIPDVDHGGAYCVVLAGDVLLGGRAYPEGSCIWLDPGEAPALASNRAAVVGFMSFPRDWVPDTSTSGIVGQARATPASGQEVTGHAGR